MPQPHDANWQLPNGIDVNYLNLVGNQGCSALIRVNVGSAHAPEEWPGLAHLTEHMLFNGGARFQDSQRLMPWIQQQGGQLNATTGLTTTCFYFQSGPEQLIPGVLRLLDMLLLARLDPVLLPREVQIIEAEYQLRAHDNSTLIDALVRSQILQPKSMNRFNMGNAAEFGDDMQQLGDVLRVFYEQHYLPGNMQLWLTGDRSFAELRQQFRSSKQPILQIQRRSATATPVALQKFAEITIGSRSGYLGLNHQSAIILSYAINYASPNLSVYWGLFKDIIEDKAPHSLVWQLAQLDKQCNLTANLISHSRNHLLFNIQFQASQLTAESVPALRQTLTLWFKQAAELTEKQQQHYLEKYQRSQSRRPLMEQLRNHALELDGRVTDLSTEGWQCLLSQLIATEPQGCYLLDAAIATMTPKMFAGFTLPFQDTKFPPLGDPLTNPKPIFYPRPCPAVTTEQNQPAAPAFIESTEGKGLQILIRPAPGTCLTADWRRQLLTAVTPLFSLLSHYGGQGEWRALPSCDMLCWQAPNPQIMLVLLTMLQAEWPKFSETAMVDTATGEILLKSLLTRFPSLINRNDSTLWTASIAGLSAAAARPLCQQLASMPVQWVTELNDRVGFGEGIKQHESQSSRENALIAFIPFSGQQGSEHAAKILSRYYEPAFYQWLREELAIGYAVSCRYQNVCDLQGMLFLLQSSGVGCLELKRYCELFVEKMTGVLINSALNTVFAEEPAAGEYSRQITNLLQRCLGNPFVMDENKPLQHQVIALHEELVMQLKNGGGYWLTSGET